MNESNLCARGAHRALPGITRNRYHERLADRPVDATIWRKKAEAVKCGGGTDEKERRIFAAIDNDDHVCSAALRQRAGYAREYELVSAYVSAYVRERTSRIACRSYSGRRHWRREKHEERKRKRDEDETERERERVSEREIEIEKFH